MTHSQRYHCLIGIPGSGKSTFAQYFLELLPETLYICPDRIRQQLYGNALVQGDWSDIQLEISKQFAIAQVTQQSVLYDATNIIPDWRRDILKRYQPTSGQWVGWVFKTPLDVCLQRNRDRQRQVPEAIIRHYEQSFKAQPPQLVEGFSELVIISGSIRLAELKQLLISLLEH